MRLTAVVLSLVVFTAAGCSVEPSAPPAEPTPPAEPAAPVEPAAPAAEDIGATAASNDPAVINFEGFGPAKFGGDEEQVRMSWGRPLEAGTPGEGATCYYLWMDPRPEAGYGIAFMFEDGGFRRYDVDSPLHVAPGDFTVGALAEDVLARFAGRVEDMPHKYVEGARYLVVSPEQGGDARLVFVVSAQGVVTEWRMGMLPQALYVEGCG